MTSDNRATIEQELQALGARELELETLLQELRLRSRHAGRSGQQDVADQAWTLFETFRSELAQLQLKIRGLEARVYSSKQRAKA